ncbi:hypothetical protein [Sediminicurvatus halobius]|uniref:Uncharacterized protein n=1 Tax=Sediminicurvatus halobius TaxID=2182432 RepID=A0A2U2MXJ1_9GAMM|nr:hypothetical protein [Spiribacter halobius]PWG61611.1 hypothetical protein DEM34_15595 [Spiribacter halobius]UEX77289.1 hypothetical protein LMH63_15265 [Spiribacter halobius]
MNRHVAIATLNLLPLSVSDEFRAALAEWHFTGHVIDYPPKSGWVCCELCEQLHLSHNFEIANSQTNTSLLVDSSCILRFPEIVVRDRSGVAVTDAASRNACLREALQTRLKERALEPLQTALKKTPEHRPELERIVGAITECGRLDPKDILSLFDILRCAGIAFIPSDYTVNIRSAQATRQMLAMSESQRERIRPALSRDQFKRFAYLFRENDRVFSP